MSHKWIKVTDRLPEHGQKVLTVVKNGNCIPNIDIDITTFYKRKTKEECERIGDFGFSDRHGNNWFRMHGKVQDTWNGLSKMLHIGV